MRKFSSRRAGTVLLGMLAGGCTETAPFAADHDVETLPVLVLEQELTIGSIDDPETGFSRVAGVRVSKDGRVYVLDSLSRQVQVFDSDGNFIRSVGRSGSGPGEFESPSRIGVVGDTLWVSDGWLRRFTLFNLDGDVIASIPIEPVLVPVDLPGFTVHVAPLELRGDGYFNSSIEIGVSGSVPGRGVPDSASVPAYVFDHIGMVIDSAGTHPFGGKHSNLLIYDGLVTVLPGALAASPIRIPWGADLIVIDRPVARTRDAAVMRVIHLDEVGDTIYVRNFRYDPESVSAAYIDSIIDSRSQVGHDPSGGSSMAAVLRDALSEYIYYPPIAAHLIGEDGSVWMQRNDRAREQFRWLVLHPGGSPRGTVQLPRGAMVQWSDGDLVWVSEPDELGVPWLKRYRLEGE